MKTLAKETIKPLIATLIVTFLFILNLTSQNTIMLSESFNKISVDGPITAHLEKSDNSFIELLKSPENIEDLITIAIVSDELQIGQKGRASDIEIVIHYKDDISEITGKGISDIRSRTKLHQDFLKLKSESAADMNLELELEKLEVNLSGASTIRLKGSAQQADIKASGASDLKAFDFQVSSATIEASGASDVKLDVSDKAIIKTSGASDVKLKNKPTDLQAESKGVSGVKYGEEAMSQSTETIEKDNTKRKRRSKFDGHWAGVELGFNTMVNNQFQTTLPAEYSFLDLNMGKSLTVQMNFFEQSVSLSKNNNFGLVTGLGLWVNNYRFGNNIVLVSDSSHIFGYADTTKNYIKSKLTASYLVLPLMFEYQFRDSRGKNMFHISLGGYGGVRIGSKTKTVHMHENTKIKSKEHDDFKLNQFKYGLSARMGWKWINVFANYNLSSMFKSNKGPEMYPFEVGISLTGR
jgi:hypothetical protein